MESHIRYLLMACPRNSLPNNHEGLLARSPAEYLSPQILALGKIKYADIRHDEIFVGVFEGLGQMSPCGESQAV